MTDTVTALFESECSGSIPWTFGASDGLPVRHEPEPPVVDTKAVEVAATRHIVDMLKKLPSWAQTPAAYGHILSVLSAEIGKSPFSHTRVGEDTQRQLDMIADDLEGA